MGELVIPKEWGMDDDDRPRYVNKKNEEKDHVTCRVPTKLVRYIDEYVASRADPYCRTRSDAVNDAIVAWVAITKDSGSSATASMALRIELLYSRYQKEDYEDMLKDSELEIDEAIKDQNTNKLVVMRNVLSQARETFVKKCGKVSVDKLDKLIHRVEEILGHAQETLA